MDSSARRGHHRVFLGMAAGVGKTYRMLQEGQAVAEAGRDVAIGYLEPHDRPETAAQAEGLEVIPRRRVTYRDTELEEMDLPAVLERSPELALIDEIAHTNAPGLEHEKRYEDVKDIVAAGIDVFSTVNVQHLESLNDQVAELTGIRMRETIPDDVLRAADEVVLVDLTPEALLERLRAGKIYPAERIEPALQNFFQIEKLSALREVALRQAADEVELKRLVAQEDLGSRGERLSATAAPQAIGERLLALIRPTPRSQRLVRRAWRSSRRLGADLDLLYVRAPGTVPEGEEAEQLKALQQARLGPGRPHAGGGGRRHRRGHQAGRRGARHDLRADRAQQRLEGPPRAAARAAPDEAARGAAGRRPPRGRRPHAAKRKRKGARAMRILFPFLGSDLSNRALDAALRLAAAEEATLVPAYLARVPLNMPLDSPLPRQSELAIPIMEAIEQRAAKSEVPIDSRVERGRTYRHALRQLLEGEHFDRIIAPGAGRGSDGFSPEDVAWLLDNAEGEIVIFRSGDLAEAAA